MTAGNSQAPVVAHKQVPMDMAWAPNSQPRLILIPQLDEADERLAELRKELAELEAAEEEWAHGVEAEATQVAALEEEFTKQV